MIADAAGAAAAAAAAAFAVAVAVAAFVAFFGRVCGCLPTTCGNLC